MFIHSAESKLPDIKIPTLMQDLEKVIYLATILGARCLELREKGLTVTIKEDGTKVTNADLETSASLVRELVKIRNCPIVSEEVKSLPSSLELSGKEWWLVDPIDGTNTFIHGYPGFAICIALIKDGEPIMGIVAVPALDKIYYAVKDCGAFVRTGGKDLELEASPRASREFRFGGFYKYTPEHTQKLNEFFELNSIEKSAMQPVSAALKYCAVAEGELDMAGGWSSLRIWDIAAASLIVTEAGGQFQNFQDGKPFVFTTDSTIVTAPMALGKDVRVLMLPNS